MNYQTNKPLLTLQEYTNFANRLIKKSKKHFSYNVTDDLICDLVHELIKADINHKADKLSREKYLVMQGIYAIRKYLYNRKKRNDKFIQIDDRYWNKNFSYCPSQRQSRECSILDDLQFMESLNDDVQKREKLETYLLKSNILNDVQKSILKLALRGRDFIQIRKELYNNEVSKKYIACQWNGIVRRCILYKEHLLGVL